MMISYQELVRTFPSTIKRMITNSLILSIGYRDKLKAVKDTLHFLGMSEKLAITYNLNRKTLLKKQPPLNTILKKNRCNFATKAVR